MYANDVEAALVAGHGQEGLGDDGIAAFTLANLAGGHDSRY